MTSADMLVAVDAYLAAHLDAAFWSGLPTATKTGASTMAQADVEAATATTLDLIGSVDHPFVKAVAEQAVYLARNYASQNEGKVVTGESVEGLSNTYTLIGTPGTSPRANVFIKQAKRAALVGIRFGRG